MDGELNKANDVLNKSIAALKFKDVEIEEARRQAEHMRDSFLRLTGGHPDSIKFPWEELPK